MKTELRVIDLGNGYGKVVRHFQKREPPPPPFSLSLATGLYRNGLITLMDLQAMLEDVGYSPSEVELLLMLIERG